MSARDPAACMHAMPYGAQRLADGRTRFRLWAPDRAVIGIELNDHDATPMQALPDGWFELITSAPPGTRYRYRLDEHLTVPDPASRQQLAGDVHGASVVCDPLGYRWRNPRWCGRPWRETVIQEVHVGASGGFAGVQAQLPALAELGITAIELMPIGQFPGACNWGYDGVLPYAPAAAYGTPDSLKMLIDQAHALGLMVFLDVVYNHFGPDGNYLHAYASPFFHDEAADAEPATPWGAAIDVAVPQVGDFFVHNALYWLEEFRFDGLRFDAVHTLHNSAWLVSLARRVRATVGANRHVHLMLENENNQATLLGDDRFDAQWNDDFHNAMHVLLTGESAGYYGAYADRPMAHLLRCLGEGFAWQGEAMRGHARGEPSAQVSPLCFINFLQNHDQIGNRAQGDRLTTLLAAPLLDALYPLLLLSPAIPLLFMGEEFAAREPFLFFTDHQNAALRDAVRDGRRREFAEFASFDQADAVPDPNERATFERSRPDPGARNNDEGRARHALIGALLSVRHAQLVPRLEGVRALGARAFGRHALLARWQLRDGAQLCIYSNLGDSPINIDTAPTRDAQWWHGSAHAVAALTAHRLPPTTTLVCLEPSA